MIIFHYILQNYLIQFYVWCPTQVTLQSGLYSVYPEANVEVLHTLLLLDGMLVHRRFTVFSQDFSVSLFYYNEMGRKIAKCDSTNKMHIWDTTWSLKNSKYIPQNGHINFWKIKLNELQFNFILAILNFIPKLLVLFCSSFLSNLLIYLVESGNVAEKLGKRNFIILAG